MNPPTTIPEPAPPPTSLELVREFHTAYGVPTAAAPDLENIRTNRLRLDLLREELEELTFALTCRDVVATLDALTDLQYVLDGTYLALGFAPVKDAAFAEVHRSNMSKLGADGRPILRGDGKILKGPNYTPPDLSQFIATRPLTLVPPKPCPA